MFRFFFQSLSRENKALLKHDSLNEVVVESDSGNEMDVTVSAPFNVVHKPSRAAEYEEIKACITILQDAKKNLASYVTCQQKRLHFLGVYNLMCLLATSGVTFTLMLKLHEHLASLVQQKIAPLLPVLNQAIRERDLFMNWYHGELDKQYAAIDKYVHPESYCGYDNINNAFIQFDSICSYPPLPRTRHGGRDYVKLCALNPDRVYPATLCEPQVEPLCEAELAYFACLDPLYDGRSQAEQSIRQFKADQAAQVNALNYRVNDLQLPVDAIKNHTWEPISTGVFTLSATACFSLVIYLSISWRNAYHAYQNDLAAPHALPDCVAINDLNRIMNLAAALDIPLPLEGIVFDTLLSTLASKKLEAQPKEARISFLQVAHRHQLPAEVSRLILEEAEMIEPRRRQQTL